MGNKFWKYELQGEKTCFDTDGWTINSNVSTSNKMIYMKINSSPYSVTNGPRQANLVLIAYASSEGSGEPAHPRSLARTFAARIGDK